MNKLWCDKDKVPLVLVPAATATFDTTEIIEHLNGSREYYYYAVYKCPKCKFQVRLYQFGGKPK